MAIRKKGCIFVNLLCLLVLLCHGCAWMRSMRQDVYGDEYESKHQSRALASQGINKLPPPATVMDRHLNAFRGEPIDLSGVRHKSQRTTKNDFVAMNAKNENSLWKADGQTNYFFAVNKNKVPGDLITVNADDVLKMDMKRELSRIIDSEDYEKGVEISGFGVVGGSGQKRKDSTAPSASGEQTAEASNAQSYGNTQANASAASAETQLRTVASEKDETKIQYIAEVMEVFPNGNMLIRGIKRVPYNGKVHLLEVTSIMKSSDVPENNEVDSSKFFEHRAEIVR